MIKIRRKKRKKEKKLNETQNSWAQKTKTHKAKTRLTGEKKGIENEIK